MFDGTDLILKKRNKIKPFIVRILSLLNYIKGDNRKKPIPTRHPFNHKTSKQN